MATQAPIAEEAATPVAPGPASAQQRAYRPGTLRTVNDVFFTGIRRNVAEAMKVHDADWNWTAISSAEVYLRVRKLAAALRTLGVKPGDRVAILAENRWEWAVADFAILALGAIDVPLYPTLLPAQISAMLQNSGARIAIVSGQEAWSKVQCIGQETAVEHVIAMDDVRSEDVLRMSELMASTAPMDEQEFERTANAVTPDQIATLIYTSGTTGEPKGVMLTHGNIASNLNYSTTVFEWDPSYSCVSFLPLSHVTARALDYAVFKAGAVIAYCPQFADVVRCFADIKPRIVVAVPRVYEKVRQEVERKAGQAGLKKKIFNWALGVGAQHRDEVLAGKPPSGIRAAIAKKLVFGKIHQAFGGRVAHFVSGGAPLGMETAQWFADIGIRIYEGYGLTETSPVISLNNMYDYRIGSVGKVLRNVEVKFADDGELLARAPSVFIGYWHNEKATQEAITADGWFHTGDIARLDDDGFLYITDRKKELLKTSGGKFIAPALIENRVKVDTLIANCALIGDKRNFASMVISPNFAALDGWAKSNGVASDVTSPEGRNKLVCELKVIARYRETIEKTNRGLAQFETIKKFYLAPEEWTVEGGEMTPSMKLKRRVINENYKSQIEGMYANDDRAA